MTRREAARSLIAVLCTLGGGVLCTSTVMSVAGHGGGRVLIGIGVGLFLLAAGWWVTVLADRVDPPRRH